MADAYSSSFPYPDGPFSPQAFLAEKFLRNWLGTEEAERVLDFNDPADDSRYREAVYAAKLSISVKLATEAATRMGQAVRKTEAAFHDFGEGFLE